MVRTQVQLTKEQVNQLKRLASTRHLSVAALVRQAVDILIKSPAAVDIKERRKRAIAAAGRFRSKLPDLSSAHDKYLTEAFEK